MIGSSSQHGGARLAKKRPAEPMVEVAPHQYVQMDLKLELPEMVLCDVVAQADGSYKLVPRTWERFERLTSDISRKLGLGDRTDTLRRLIRGGFVAGAKVSPDLYTINLASYFQHYDRCADDPYYWNDPKVLAEYRATLDR
jgi:hypothetical protein